MIPRSRRVLISLLLVCFLAAGPDVAGGTTIGDADFTCAFCGRQFTDKIIWSTNVMDRDPEFRPLAMGLDPLPYLVHACPHCGFTDGRDEAKLSEPERRDLGKFLTDFRQAHGGVRGAAKYEVLANIYILRKLPSERIAFAFQQAAWIADDSHDAAAARRYRAATLEYLVKTLDNPEIEPKKVPTLTYLVGELKRRLGRFDEALQWFSRVKPDNPRLEELLSQQTARARKKDADHEKTFR